ncbi:hypothetical protein Q3V30_12520 [Erwinia pyri]|uniref:Uncharacterized protein n=1 Tax=Erwinia pyri TaxID=3062598 RepID=A0AA50DFP0_9GAMM|nr:hypothetical protein [Erwinia sp. DE2]WLS77314.1 hypothetical protein Q3V30_12520 [Erwinia sp. DE2]
MKLLSCTKSNAEINFTESEIIILNSALNEIFNGIDIEEFETRIGSEKESAAILLSNLGGILDKMSSC